MKLRNPMSVKFDEAQRLHLQQMACAEGHGRAGRYLKSLVDKDMAEKAKRRSKRSTAA